MRYIHTQDILDTRTMNELCHCYNYNDIIIVIPIEKYRNSNDCEFRIQWASSQCNINSHSKSQKSNGRIRHSTQYLCLIRREDRIKRNIFAYFSTNLSLVTKLQLEIYKPTLILQCIQKEFTKRNELIIQALRCVLCRIRISRLLFAFVRVL